MPALKIVDMIKLEIMGSIIFTVENHLARPYQRARQTEITLSLAYTMFEYSSEGEDKELVCRGTVSIIA